MSVEKFVLSVPLSDQRVLLRQPVSGKWELHDLAKSKRSMLSEGDQVMINAAIRAGVEYAKS